MKTAHDSGMAFQKILAAFDFSASAGHAVQWAHGLASASNAKLEVVHVHPELYDGRGDPELGLPWPSAGQEERYLRFLEQELKTSLLSLLGPAANDVGIHIARGDAAKHIVEVAKQIAADVVCVGSTGKGGVQRVLVGSVSESVLRASPLPVLIVPSH